MSAHDGGTAPDVTQFGCATCRTPLNVFKAFDGPTVFVHPDGSLADHDPAPVPLDQLPAIVVRCDFCSSPHTVASFAFSPLEIVAVDEDDEPAMTRALDGNWSACEGCARLVEARDVAGLTDRAIRRAIRTGSPAPIETFGPLHRALFAATPITPPRRPLTIKASQNSPSPASIALTPTPAQQADSPEVRTLRPQMLPKVRDRLVRFWRTSGFHFLAEILAEGAVYSIPGHLLPGAALDAEAARLDITNAAPLRHYTALMANHIENGRMFWVDAEFTALAAHAARDLPDVRVLPAELPAPDGVLVWQKPIYHGTEPVTGTVVPIIAAQWGPIPGGVWVAFYTPAECLMDQPLAERELQELRESLGWLAPVNTGVALRYGHAHTPANDATRAMLCALIATWILTTQPDAEITEKQADKATAKAYKRTKRPAPLVRLVRLRRKQQARTNATAGTSTRVYTRRWWVSGFFREQPYGPGRSLRRRTYVRPHSRGPADAPLILTEQVRILGNPADRTKE